MVYTVNNGLASSFFISLLCGASLRDFYVGKLCLGLMYLTYFIALSLVLGIFILRIENAFSGTIYESNKRTKRLWILYILYIVSGLLAIVSLGTDDIDDTFEIIKYICIMIFLITYVSLSVCVLWIYISNLKLLHTNLSLLMLELKPSNDTDNKTLSDANKLYDTMAKTSIIVLITIISTFIFVGIVLFVSNGPFGMLLFYMNTLI